MRMPWQEAAWNRIEVASGISDLASCWMAKNIAKCFHATPSESGEQAENAHKTVDFAHRAIDLPVDVRMRLALDWVYAVSPISLGTRSPNQQLTVLAPT